MKFSFKSIRWRLQAWHGLLLLLVLAAFAIRSYFLMQDTRFTAVDQELRRASAVVVITLPPSALRTTMGHTLRMALLGGPRPGISPALHDLDDESATNAVFSENPFRQQVQEEFRAIADQNERAGFYYILWKPDGAVLQNSPNSPPNVPRPVAGKLPGFQGRTRGEFREQFIAADGYELLMGRSIAAEFAALRRHGVQLALAVGVIMLVGLAGGWWLYTRAIRPIKEISAAAGKIAAGNLAERINVSETDSELGQLAGVLNASFDQVQAAFNRLQSTLDQQVQFTADASHELRTPVSVILAETNSALARERTPAEYQEALESCRNAARRLRRLTESLLTLARLDAGEQRGKREPCDLQLLALDAIKLLRPLADERGVAIHAQMGPGPCLGDPEQLGHVVTNLVSNAIQYNRQGGEVRVRVTSEGQMAILNVIDTGQGIAAEDLPHIFDRFYRADKSRQHANGHLGLGLAIAKAIVEAHGGAIHVSSEAGTGSAFTVSIKQPEIGRMRSTIIF